MMRALHSRLGAGATIALAVFLAIAIICALAPWIGLHDSTRMAFPLRFDGPSWVHPLGNDEYGRDILSRIVWGGRNSLMIAFSSVGLACVVGTMLGIVGGYFRGFAEFLSMRSMDVLLCFPPLLLALLVVTILGPGSTTLIPLLALVYLPGFTRIAYAGTISVREQPYVEAVRTMGAPSSRIMLLTILPNIAGPVLVQFSLDMASAIVLEAGLSFLGLGVVPPDASWGQMIGAGRAVMSNNPQILLWPCLALSLTILSINVLCDGLQGSLSGPLGMVVHGPFHFLSLRRGKVPQPVPSAPALRAEGLSVTIDPEGKVPAVRDVTLEVAPGETLALVGESGSGKTLTGLAIAGLLGGTAHRSGGRIEIAGHDFTAAPRAMRGRHVAMVFQDPAASLNPVHRVGDQMVEMIRNHQSVGKRQARRIAIDLFRKVGIPDPERRITAYPHEMSGGMRQRVMIAMAVANEPRLLIADEPTTALDVTIQAQILDVLDRLKREQGLGMVFVTHSLPVVADIADRVAVLYGGEVVEEGTREQIFVHPRHPYTIALLKSMPSDDGRAPQGIAGSVPSPFHLPSGCSFAPRCPHAKPECEAARPAIDVLADGHKTRCIRWRDL